MTPSAARGILEAIYWKPEFFWQVREIWVLKEIRHITFLRNEIGVRQQDRPLLVEDCRQQRTTRCLRDVAYVIVAVPAPRRHATDNPRKYEECFQRRIEKGQCHHTPYLGTREFAACFSAPTGDDAPLESLSVGLGSMLFDYRYRQDPTRAEMQFWRHDGEGRRMISGCAEALFFDAELSQGKLIVKPEEYGRLEASDA
jgi:CRISPR-associated protein Cas5d